MSNLVPNVIVMLLMTARLDCQMAQTTSAY